VDSAGDTVLQLQVHFRDGVVGENGGVRDITDGSRLNHVADSESLDRLVLGDAAGAVGAAHGLDVAAAVLVTTAVGRNKSSQFSRFKKCLSVEIENKAFLLPS
jgi:hypothetical protein